MQTILITGARGFIGRNLCAHLRPRNDVQLREFDLGSDDAQLAAGIAEADVIFHLAGVNRPERVEDYEEGNAGFTAHICRLVAESERKPHIITTSSIQAEFENPYGTSKRHAEQALVALSESRGVPVSIFRLKNVFGKWCRPNYNSVVATFCHNIARDLPIHISDPSRVIELVHVDDVVAALIGIMHGPRPARHVFVPDSMPSYSISLGDLAGRIQSFRQMQESLLTPDFSLRFNQQLYSTYLSCVAPSRWEYGLDVRSDPRGNLAEFIKSPWFGQIFVSRTHPGITRGNHYHHVKTEKFLVLSGEGLIRFRHIEGTEILEFRVCGEVYRVVEIPPGYTHAITNVGQTEMITLFWSSEVFDPDRPDTYWMAVDGDQRV